MNRFIVLCVGMFCLTSGVESAPQTAYAGERWMCRVVAEYMPIVAYGDTYDEASENLDIAFRNQYPRGALSVQEPKRCKRISR